MMIRTQKLVGGAAFGVCLFAVCLGAMAAQPPGERVVRPPVGAPGAGQAQWRGSGEVVAWRLPYKVKHLSTHWSSVEFSIAKG